MSDFDNYALKAATTAIYPPDRGLEYLGLGLTSEAGEVAGKIKKLIRDKDGYVDYDAAMDLAAELGDVLWYVAMLCNHIGISMQHVADGNITKLASRQTRGALQGSGDNR